MKLVNISIAAIMALGSSVFAADTLADAFKNGNLKGEIQAYYFDEDKTTSEGDIITLGVDIDYETDAFYGFKAGFGFQSSASPWADEDGKTMFKKDMWGSGAELSQAYLSYTMSKTTVKVGRQYIKVPLLKGSGSRVNKESYEGATIISKDLPKTTLYAAYIQKFQSRTDQNGDFGEFENLGTDVDYGYALAVENKSLPGATLLAAYGSLDNEHDIMYLEAKYANKAEGFSYNLAAQYNDTDYEDDATEDASFYGLKVGVGVADVKAYVAYAEVEDGSAQHGVKGVGTATTIYTTAVTQAGYYNESEQIAFDINYNIKDIGVLFGVRYLDIDVANTANDITRTAGYASYKFSGQLKGLSTLLQYEETETKNSNDHSELRFKVNYKF